MVTDSISDCLTRIRNAQRAGHKSARLSVTSQTKVLLDVLKSEGFIDGYEHRKGEKLSEHAYEVFLKYYSVGEPMMTVIRRISKPGRRVYRRFQDLQKIRAGLGISVISTSQGVMSDREARRRKLGGEVLADIA